MLDDLEEVSLDLPIKYLKDKNQITVRLYNNFIYY
jgi:hypothetical protein